MIFIKIRSFLKEFGIKVILTNIGYIFSQYPTMLIATFIAMLCYADFSVEYAVMIGVVIYAMFVWLVKHDESTGDPKTNDLFYVKKGVIHMRCTHRYHGRIKEMFEPEIQRIFEYIKENDIGSFSIKTHHYFMTQIVFMYCGADVSISCLDLKRKEKVVLKTTSGEVKIMYDGMLINPCSRYKYKWIMTLREFLNTFKPYRYYTIEFNRL